MSSQINFIIWAKSAFLKEPNKTFVLSEHYFEKYFGEATLENMKSFSNLLAQLGISAFRHVNNNIWHLNLVDEKTLREFNEIEYAMVNNIQEAPDQNAEDEDLTTVCGVCGQPSTCKPRVYIYSVTSPNEPIIATEPNMGSCDLHKKEIELNIGEILGGDTRHTLIKLVQDIDEGSVLDFDSLTIEWVPVN